MDEFKPLGGGAAVGGVGGHGRAVQVVGIKPELKARQVSALETKM
jgi:hypothetical protein